MMKEVKITITGTILIVEYCSTKHYDEENGEDFFSNYYMTLGWDSVEGLYVNDNEEENLIKKKGKYFKTKEYFHNLFSEDGDHPLPVEIHARNTHGGDEFHYIIELEDDEEFDIKKLQMIKSDYEFEGMPYYILVEKILYDGKEIQLTTEDQDYYVEYSIDGRYCNEWTIDSLYD